MSVKSEHQEHQALPFTVSADVKADKQESVWKEDPEVVTAPASASSDVNQTSKTAKTKDVGVAGFRRSSKPRYHVQSIDESYEVFGVDAIWQNQYAGPKTDFMTFRKQYHCDIDAMILMVARHVAQGLYSVISMNATPHMLTVICGCEKPRADLPGDIWDDPAI